MPETTRFDCPNCAAEYKLVRAEAGPPPDHQIECRRCGAPLQGREGKFILKYFLVGRGRTQAKAARAGKGPPRTHYEARRIAVKIAKLPQGAAAEATGARKQEIGAA